MVTGTSSHQHSPFFAISVGQLRSIEEDSGGRLGAGHVCARRSFLAEAPGRLRWPPRRQPRCKRRAHRPRSRRRLHRGDGGVRLRLLLGVGARPHVAAFHGLVREHLDYHGSMERYLDAKARVWDLLTPGEGVAVVFGRSDASLRDAAPRGGRRRAGPHRRRRGDGRSDRQELRRRRGGLVLRPRGSRVPGCARELPLPGRQRRERPRCSRRRAVPRRLRRGDRRELGAAVAPPGRLERVSAGAGAAPFEVMVDYARSPDAMERVLADDCAVTSTVGTRPGGSSASSAAAAIATAASACPRGARRGPHRGRLRGHQRQPPERGPGRDRGDRPRGRRRRGAPRARATTAGRSSARSAWRGAATWC